MPGNFEPGLESMQNFLPRRADLRHAAATRSRSRSMIETCGVRILRYVVVNDSGRIINPMIVEGQIVGGVAHAHRQRAVRMDGLRRRRAAGDHQFRRLSAGRLDGSAQHRSELCSSTPRRSIRSASRASANPAACRRLPRSSRPSRRAFAVRRADHRISAHPRGCWRCCKTRSETGQGAPLQQFALGKSRAPCPSGRVPTLDRVSEIAGQGHAGRRHVQRWSCPGFLKSQARSTASGCEQRVHDRQAGKTTEGRGPQMSSLTPWSRQSAATRASCTWGPAMRPWTSSGRKLPQCPAFSAKRVRVGNSSQASTCARARASGVGGA